MQTSSRLGLKELRTKSHVCPATASIHNMSMGGADL